MSGREAAWAPYCGPGSGPGDWLLRWNLDPVLLATVAILLAAGVLRVPGRARAQAAAAALALVLFVSPFCALGSALFGARALHHLVLSLGLAPLLWAAMGGRARAALPLGPATALQAAVFWLWHAPPVYAAALRSDALFWAMQISITGSALLWWQALARASALGRLAALLATMVQMGLLGALIVFAARPLYAPHWLTAGAWGFTPLEDQQLGGLVMWVVGGGAYLALAARALYRDLAPSGHARAA